MEQKLITKLIISFLIVILLSTILGIAISNYKLDKNFEKYLEDKKNKTIDTIVNIVENNCDEESAVKRSQDIELLAKSEQLYIRVEDLDGRITFETKNYVNVKKDESNMDSNNLIQKTFHPKYYKEEKYELIKNNKKIGNVMIGYYGLDNCTSRDLQMKDTITNTLIETALGTLIIGIIISIFLARHLSIPLKNMTKTTNEIRKGNLDVCLDEKSSTYEINELSNAIKYLVKSLENKDMLRKRLAADMSHEIRNPLMTLQNTMEAFLYGVWEPTKERLESCYEETIRLSKLVERLKDINKLEEASTKLNIQEFNITDELNQLLELFRPQYQNKNINLIFKSDGDILINSDKDKIKQVIVNLLNNAYNYTDQGGKVEVALEKRHKNIVICVKDNGIGISKDDLSFIFERFYRIDENRDRKTGGMGIGLTISKALVNAIGGTINGESKLGEGTMFSVSLPIKN